MLAELSEVVATTTTAFEGYDHTAALQATESFFWRFCDDYIELVKERAYGSGAGADSARAALATALSVQLRLFAPVLPYATEEVWSWWRYGSVHRAPWPTTYEVGRTIQGDGDPHLLRLAADALGQVRRAKSERKLSMRAEVPLAEALGPAALLDQLTLVIDDLRAAGRINKLDLLPDRTPELVIACASEAAAQHRETCCLDSRGAALPPKVLPPDTRLNVGQLVSPATEKERRRSMERKVAARMMSAVITAATGTETVVASRSVGASRSAKAIT